MVFAELEAARDATASLAQEKAAWEADKTQQEGQIQAAKENLAQAASALEADQNASAADMAAVTAARTYLANGNLTTAVSYTDVWL